MAKNCFDSWKNDPILRIFVPETEWESEEEKVATAKVATETARRCFGWTGTIEK